MSEVNLCDTFLRGNTLCFKDYIIEGDKIVFSSCNYNGLYQYDWKKQELKYLGSFKNENLLMKSLHSKIIKHDELYLFLPYYARSIDIYNIEKKEFCSMELPLPRYACHAGGKFQTAEWYENKLYLFPKQYSYILEIDFTKNCVQIYDEWNAEKIVYQPDVEQGFGTCCLCGDGIVCLPMVKCNKILRFDLKNKEYRFITVQTECEGFQTLSYIKNSFYATTMDGRIVRFQADGSDVSVIRQCDTQFRHCVVMEERYLWLFANDEDTILVMDTKEGEINIHTSMIGPDEGSYDVWEYERVWFAKKTADKKLAYMDRTDRALKVINAGDGNEITFELEKDFVDDTKHANSKVDVVEFYGFWMEYHDEVARTLRYRKPLIIKEEFDTGDSMRFMFSIIDQKKRQDDQGKENRRNVGLNIWEEVGVGPK